MGKQIFILIIIFHILSIECYSYSRDQKDCSILLTSQTDVLQKENIIAFIGNKITRLEQSMSDFLLPKDRFQIKTIISILKKQIQNMDRFNLNLLSIDKAETIEEFTFNVLSKIIILSSKIEIEASIQHLDILNQAHKRFIIEETKGFIGRIIFEYKHLKKIFPSYVNQVLEALCKYTDEATIAFINLEYITQ